MERGWKVGTHRHELVLEDEGQEIALRGVLHDDADVFARLKHLVHVDDVRVAQTRQGLFFFFFFVGFVCFSHRNPHRVICTRSAHDAFALWLVV